jgi:hypothetical protein
MLCAEHFLLHRALSWSTLHRCLSCGDTVMVSATAGMTDCRKAVLLTCLTFTICFCQSASDNGSRGQADSRFHHATHKTKHPKGVEHCHMKVDYTDPEAVTRDNFEYDIVITSGLRC